MNETFTIAYLCHSLLAAGHLDYWPTRVQLGLFGQWKCWNKKKGENSILKVSHFGRGGFFVEYEKGISRHLAAPDAVAVFELG